MRRGLHANQFKRTCPVSAMQVRCAEKTLVDLRDGRGFETKTYRVSRGSVCRSDSNASTPAAVCRPRQPPPKSEIERQCHFFRCITPYCNGASITQPSQVYVNPM